MTERLPDPVPERLRAASKSRERNRPVVPAELETIYELGLPSKRLGIEAKDGNGRTIWLLRSIGRKPYNCPRCHNRIDVGTEHSLVRVLSGTSIDDHHHLHKLCSYTWINPNRLHETFEDSPQKRKDIRTKQVRFHQKRRRRLREGRPI